MMKAISNKLRIGLSPIFVLLTILITTVSLGSCSKDDELEIQKNFPFEIKVMPVPKEIANGQTVEIRMTIQRMGNYRNTEYSLRYFQFDGQGSLRYFDAPPYAPNDLYRLPLETFRLYYTSTSSISESFEIWISDSFGNEKHLSFKFNSKD